MKPVIALTMGDPAGIGPELCLKMLHDPAVLAEATPVIHGSRGVLERVAAACGLPMPAEGALVECGSIDARTVMPGTVNAACGQAAFDSIRCAVERAMRGEVAGVATAPINKEALHGAGVPYPGHTEILAALTGSPRVCMMLASDVLTVSMVTTHIGLCDVPGKLTEERILDVIRLTDGAVRRLRGRAMKLGVCGLNPHAGEHGLFGRGEEEAAILPAILAARAAGIDVEGPIPPDTAFVPNRREAYGAIVCMYHDQGHIPFKMLAFDTGVNITLGLPIVRVSVDHGTAFDIAWKGIAEVTSMRQAVLYTARLGSPGWHE
ncbi:MAG: 4-hydroxythreonine-4-phosphate dehydrogenase PdxA [Acidobacteria bacterium]|nr:4-hydroxythreonine-4-phosphate dehydrogenase PdxA [Acidobacteriota bacterium]